MPDYPLNVPFKTPGHWWLADAPEREIAGTLTYRPGEMSRLDLLAAFKPPRGALPSDLEADYDLIHGVTSSGEAVTVASPQRQGWRFRAGSGGVAEPETVVSTLVIVGAYASSGALFAEMRFRIPGLPIWWSQPIIQQSISKNADGRQERWFRPVRPPAESFRIDGSQLDLTFDFDTRMMTDSFTSVTVSTTGWLVFRPTRVQTVHWYLREAQKLLTILAFIAGCPMATDCIEAPSDEPNRDVSLLVPLRDAAYCPFKASHEFFLPRSTPGLDVSGVLARWADVYPNVEEPSQLATSVLASDKLWLHVEFLSLMQALEGFHRGVVGGDYMDKESYGAVLDVLSGAIPCSLAPDHKQALSSRLRFGYQYSLRKRLNDLAARLPAEVRRIVLGGDGDVPQQWVDTRNFFTHWDKDTRPTALQGNDLHRVNLRLRHFLRLLYLDLIGVPDATITQCLQGPSRAAQELAWLNGGQLGRIDEVTGDVPPVAS